MSKVTEAIVKEWSLWRKWFQECRVVPLGSCECDSKVGLNLQQAMLETDEATEKEASMPPPVCHVYTDPGLIPVDERVGKLEQAVTTLLNALPTMQEQAHSSLVRGETTIPAPTVVIKINHEDVSDYIRLLENALEILTEEVANFRELHAANVSMKRRDGTLWFRRWHDSRKVTDVNPFAVRGLRAARSKWTEARVVAERMNSGKGRTQNRQEAQGEAGGAAQDKAQGEAQDESGQ